MTRLGLVVIALMVSACTALPQTIERGGLAPGRYLATLHVVDRNAVPGTCRRPREPQTLACAWVEWAVLESLGRSVGMGHIVVPAAANLEARDYEVATHEWCHTVAALQSLYPDPCHNEDGGVER